MSLLTAVQQNPNLPASFREQALQSANQAIQLAVQAVQTGSGATNSYSEIFPSNSAGTASPSPQVAQNSSSQAVQAPPQIQQNTQSTNSGSQTTSQSSSQSRMVSAGNDNEDRDCVRCNYRLLPHPSVELKTTAGTVLVGSSITLSWASSGAATCSAASNYGDWIGQKDLLGSQIITFTHSGYFTYTLHCTDSSSATNSQSIGVDVKPLVDISTSVIGASSGRSFSLIDDLGRFIFTSNESQDVYINKITLQFTGTALFGSPSFDVYLLNDDTLGNIGQKTCVVIKDDYKCMVTFDVGQTIVHPLPKQTRKSLRVRIDSSNFIDRPSISESLGVSIPTSDSLDLGTLSQPSGVSSGYESGPIGAIVVSY